MRSGQPSVENGQSAGGEPGVEHVLVAASARRPGRSARARQRVRLGLVHARRRSRRPGRTRPGSGGPTRAGARCTRAGCCASTRSRSLAHCSGTKRVRPSSTARIASARERLGVGVPLVAQHRLDRRLGALAVGHAVADRLDLLDQALRPRGRRARARARRSGRGRGRAPAPASLRRPSVSMMLIIGEVVAAADLEVVEVVARRDLDRARALLRVGVFVGDDRQAAADQRQDRVAADQVPVARVLGVDRDARCRRAWSRAGWSRP